MTPHIPMGTRLVEADINGDGKNEIIDGGFSGNNDQDRGNIKVFPISEDGHPSRIEGSNTNRLDALRLRINALTAGDMNGDGHWETRVQTMDIFETSRITAGFTEGQTKTSTAFISIYQLEQESDYVWMHDMHVNSPKLLESRSDPLELIADFKDHQLRSLAKAPHRQSECRSSRWYLVSQNDLLPVIHRIHLKTLDAGVHSHVNHLKGPLSRWLFLLLANCRAFTLDSQPSREGGPIHRISFVVVVKLDQLLDYHLQILPQTLRIIATCYGNQNRKKHNI